MEPSILSRSGTLLFLLFIFVTFQYGTVSCLLLSEVSFTVTFGWEIPQGGLSDGISFFAINPSGTAVFLVLRSGTFAPTDSYRDRVTFLGNRSMRNITFTMANIQTSDAGTYTCGNGAATTVIPNCGQKLIVLRNPTTPGRPVPSTSPVYSQPLTLICSSTSTTVPADHALSLTYSWLRDGTNVSPSPGSSYTFTVNTRDTHNYRCMSRESQGLESEWSPVYSMGPEYGPSVSLPTSTQAVTEGATLTVYCAVDSNPPASSVIWTKTGDSSFRQDGTTLTIPRIQRSQAGTYLCTAINALSPCGLASIQRTGSDEVRVDVQYKSTTTSLTLNSASGSVTVNETEFLNLICQVDSNQGSTIRLMNGSQELRLTDNSLSASYSRVVHCRQRGNYSCTTSSIIGAAVNNIIELAVICSPRKDETFTLQHQYASSVGSNVTLSVPVLAYPVPTFTWSRMSSTSRNLNVSFIPLSDISVMATLKLKHLQQEDFGDYHLTVENGVGEPVIITLTIVLEGPPNMPSNLTVMSDAPYSLLAAWKQEFNGGAKQNFTVEYSKDKVAWIIAGTKEESRNGEYLQLKISALEASTTYYVRVIARNMYGQKNYTQSIAGSTKEAEK